MHNPTTFLCHAQPVELWSGKQVFGVLLNPNKASPVHINLEGKSNTYSGKVCEIGGVLWVEENHQYAPGAV